ncbi:MAG: TRAP transporter large permease subunit [Bilophila wadsworthia]
MRWTPSPAGRPLHRGWRHHAEGTIANSLLAVSRCLVGRIKGHGPHLHPHQPLLRRAERSAAATVAAVGGIMIPAMEKEGYPRVRHRVNSTSGCLDSIPPSIPLIFRHRRRFISDLFVATIVPGIMGCARW